MKQWTRTHWIAALMGLGLVAAVWLDQYQKAQDAPPADICEGPDADGDGIPDGIEGTDDVDGDGMPNHEDDDSDGDGVADEAERWARGMQCPVRRDCDSDGVPDMLEIDSDDDGVPDGTERDHGLNACMADSDGDGCSDLAEVAFGGCEDAERIGVAPGNAETKTLPVALSTPGVPAQVQIEQVENHPLPPDGFLRFELESLSQQDDRVNLKVHLDPAEETEGQHYVGQLVIADAAGRPLARRAVTIQVARFVLLY